MGTDIKEVGGGPAAGLAQQYTDYLKKGVFGKGFGGAGAGGGAGSTGSPFGTTTQGFGNVLDQFVNNSFGASSYGVDTGKLDNNTGGFNFDDFNPSQVDFSQFNTSALSGFKPNVSAFSAQDLSQNPAFAGINAALMKAGGGFNPTAAARENFDLGNVDISPYTALLDRQKTQNVNDLRSRFGAGGGTSLGTPAAVAEGNYRAAQDAENATSLANIGREQQRLELERQSSAAGINAQNYGTYTNAALGGAQLNVDALSNIGKNLLGAAELKQTGTLTARGQDVTAEGLRLDAISKATGYNLDQLKAMSQQGIDVASLKNTNQGLRAANQASNRGLDIEAIAKGLGLQLEGQGLNQKDAQANRANQMSVIQSILEQLFGLSGKGISQRENIATPSAGANILSAASGIAQGIGNVARGT